MRLARARLANTFVLLCALSCTPRGEAQARNNATTTRRRGTWHGFLSSRRVTLHPKVTTREGRNGLDNWATADQGMTGWNGELQQSQRGQR